jgi:hypothetical protein
VTNLANPLSKLKNINNKKKRENKRMIKNLMDSHGLNLYRKLTMKVQISNNKMNKISRMMTRLGVGLLLLHYKTNSQILLDRKCNRMMKKMISKTLPKLM